MNLKKQKILFFIISIFLFTFTFIFHFDKICMAFGEPQLVSKINYFKKQIIEA